MPDTSRSAGRIAAFVLSLVGISAVGLPLWQPLLVSTVLALTFSPWHDRLAKAWRGRRGLTAGVFTLGIAFVILLPVCLVAVFVVKQAIDLGDLIRRTLATKGVAGLLQPLPDPLQRWLRAHDQSLFESPAAMRAGLESWMTSTWARGALAYSLSSSSHLLFSVAMMLVATFFLLRDGKELVRWVGDTSSVPPPELDEILAEFRAGSQSVIGGNVVAGAVSAVVAIIGFLITKVPAPLFMGTLTFLASFVPSLVTVVVTLPAVGLLLLLHKPWSAVFLAGWMLVVGGVIDSWLRPLLMRGRGHTHSGLLFFSLMGGILCFGAVGLVAGPLALVFFKTMASLQRRHRSRDQT